MKKQNLKYKNFKYISVFFQSRQKIFLIGFFCFLVFIFFLSTLNVLAQEDLDQEQYFEEFLLEDLIIEEKIIFEPPLIIEIPDKLKYGENFAIKGISLYSDTIIKVFFQKNNDQPILGETRTDQEGKWIYTYNQPIKEGNYNIWAIAIDNQGQESLSSEKFSLTIMPKSFFEIFEIFKGPTLVIVILLIIILIMIFLIIYLKRQVTVKKKKFKREVQKIKKATSIIFNALKEEVEEQVQEKKAYKKIKKALDISENLIEKDIENIKKRLK